MNNAFILFLFTLFSCQKTFSQSIGTDLISNSSTIDSIYTQVDIKAQYPGGEAARKKFMQAKLNGGVPLRKGCSAGVYTVIIKSTIDTSGKIIEIVAESKNGYGMEEEAIRVIKEYPSFSPAVKDGIKVKSSLNFPVTFKVFRLNSN